MADDENIAEFVLQEDEYLKEIHKSIDVLESQIHETVDEFPRAVLDSQEISALENVTQTLHSKLDLLIGPMLESRKSSDEKICKLENSYIDLQAKLKRMEEKNESDRIEIDLLKNQILCQTSYIANVSAVLGNLVWHASKEPEIINTWLSHRNKVEQFISIADKIIASFFKTYGSSLPPQSNDEYQMAMGLLGAVNNISACPEGREFLIEDKNGKSLVRNIVVFLPGIPTASGSSLKKQILFILWNTCINTRGLEYLLDLPVGYAIVHCLDEEHAENLQLLGLKLLQSISHDLVESQRLDDLFECIPIEKIQNIADNKKRGKSAIIARKILDRIFEIIKKPSLHNAVVHKDEK